ncbi:hypothetical protein P7C70_g7655, partial [Phenoliferia sp. Uapishka_3]
MLLSSPHSFGIQTPDTSSPLNFPYSYPSSDEQYPIFNHTSITAERQSILSTLLSISTAKWAQKGYSVGKDGFPITNLTEKECKSYSPECRHTYKDTFLAWSFLVDLERVEKGERGEGGVGVVDRWDIRERAVEGLLGVQPDDVYVLRDGQLYDFQFTYTGNSTSPLIIPCTTPTSHWARLVQIPALKVLPQKVLLIGSLFGSGRIHSAPPTSPPDEPLRDFLSRSMAFRNPWIIRPAEKIAGRLGGYVGVHARVGDGVFMRKAEENMERAWREVVRKLGVGREVEDGIWKEVGYKLVEEGKKKKKKGKREWSGEDEEESFVSDWTMVDDGVEVDQRDFVEYSHRHFITRRSPSPTPTLSSAPLPPPSTPLKNLNCRSPLHTTPTLLPFNTPLYLATDSRSPTTDPILAPFFAAFPCTFILSDFDRPSELNGGEIVESVGEMTKLVNKADGVKLGRLLLPFLEAVVAAKGWATVGTSGSTFSTFAAGDLHDAYALDGK